MKKLILLALAPLAMLTVPAGAQTVERQTVVRPDGSVSRTVVRGDGYGDRTVVHTERRDGGRDGDRVVRKVRRDGDREVVRTVRRGDDRRWDDRGRHGGWDRGRMVRRCWTTWRHHQRVRVCNVRHGDRY